MPRPALAATVFIAMGLPAAQAVACPQRFDPAEAMVLTTLNPPTTDRFRRSPEGLTQHQIVTTADGAAETRYLYPHPLLVGERQSGAQMLRLRYKGNPLDWLDQLPGRQGWRAAVTLYQDGEKRASGTDMLRFLGLDRVQIGDCRYAVWRIEEVMTLDGMDPITLEKAYNPDLGLVLQVVQKSPEGAVIAVTRFDRIEAVPAE